MTPRRCGNRLIGPNDTAHFHADQFLGISDVATIDLVFGNGLELQVFSRAGGRVEGSRRENDFGVR